jgi:hypothetical protein
MELGPLHQTPADQVFGRDYRAGDLPAPQYGARGQFARIPQMKGHVHSDMIGKISPGLGLFVNMGLHDHRL